MKALRIGTKLGDIEVIEVDNELRTYQRLVDGCIETTTLPDLAEHHITMVVNESGLLAGLPYNYNLYPFFFVGQVVMVGIGWGDFEGLTPDQIEFAMKWMIDLYLQR